MSVIQVSNIHPHRFSNATIHLHVASNFLAGNTTQFPNCSFREILQNDCFINFQVCSGQLCKGKLSSLGFSEPLGGQAFWFFPFQCWNHFLRKKWGHLTAWHLQFKLSYRGVFFPGNLHLSQICNINLRYLTTWLLVLQKFHSYHLGIEPRNPPIEPLLPKCLNKSAYSLFVAGFGGLSCCWIQFCWTIFCCESEIEKERLASIHGFVMDSLLSLFLASVFSAGLIIKGSLVAILPIYERSRIVVWPSLVQGGQAMFLIRSRKPSKTKVTLRFCEKRWLSRQVCKYLYLI